MSSGFWKRWVCEQLARKRGARTNAQRRAIRTHKRRSIPAPRSRRPWRSLLAVGLLCPCNFATPALSPQLLPPVQPFLQLPLHPPLCRVVEPLPPERLGPVILARESVGL